jgi:hypothetical protein
LVSRITARFTRLERLGLPRLKRLLLTRLHRLWFAALRTKRRALIWLRTRVFVVGAIAPADGRASRFGWRKDFELRFFEGWFGSGGGLR